MSAPVAGAIEAVRTRGFGVIAGAVDDELCERLRTGLRRLLDRQAIEEADPARTVDRYMVHNPLVHDPAFTEVLENPALIASMDALLGDTSIVYAYTTSTMPAGGTNYSTRLHVDCPRVIPGYVTNVGFMLALDQFTDENGATWFLPASFERTEPPSEEEFFANAERVHPAPGDLVVFHARTWHYGAPNRSGSDRHAVTINACRSYMRQRFDYPRLLGYELADQLSPTLRRVLGYNVRVPVDLDEYYVPESERLYLSGQG